MSGDKKAEATSDDSDLTQLQELSKRANLENLSFADIGERLWMIIDN